MASPFAKLVSRGGGFQWRTLRGTCTIAGGPFHLEVPYTSLRPPHGYARRSTRWDATGPSCEPDATMLPRLHLPASPVSPSPAGITRHAQTSLDRCRWPPPDTVRSNPTAHDQQSPPIRSRLDGRWFMFPRVKILPDIRFPPRYRQERPARAWLPSPEGLPARTPGGGGQTRPAAIWRFLVDGERTAFGWTV